MWSNTMYIAVLNNDVLAVSTNKKKLEERIAIVFREKKSSVIIYKRYYNYFDGITKNGYKES